LLGGALVVLVAAWLIGYFTTTSGAADLVRDVLPATTTQVSQRGDIFVGTDQAGQVTGYAGTGQADGYGGPVIMLVGISPDGVIIGARLVSHAESPGFFRLVEGSRLVPDYTGRPIGDPLQLGDDLDAVSGATLSAEGVAGAVRAAVRLIAAEGLDTTVPAAAQSVDFGLAEVCLILLFAAAFFASRVHSQKVKARLRWGTRLAGLVLVGFVYTMPLTITMVVSLLAGYWPDWRTHLYWYLLIGGILLVTAIDNKNPYCVWFCPLGAFQDCLSALSKAKTFRPRRLDTALKWTLRGLALTAIAVGLATRQPGLVGYEPYQALFDLRGSPAQWALLGMVVVAGLLTHRPFCHYLCPVRPVLDAIPAASRWVKEVGSRWLPRRARR
jgi:hypothetical protein